MTNIGVIVGSLSRQSINRRLAATLVELAPESVHLRVADISGLPLYDYEREDDFPDPVQHFKREIESSDALLFVTPEYNRSMPSPLKNALDWGSRPWGDNSWRGKRAAVIGAGLNKAGTAVAQGHLRAVLGYLGVTVVGAPETCVPWRDGVLDEPSTRSYLNGFVDAFIGSVVPRAAEV